MAKSRIIKKDNKKEFIVFMLLFTSAINMAGLWCLFTILLSSIPTNGTILVSFNDYNEMIIEGIVMGITMIFNIILFRMIYKGKIEIKIN